MSERVLVTGAGGFVCSHIVTGLLEAGYDVIALDRAFDPTWQDRFYKWTRRLEVIQGEASRLPAVKVDALVHGVAVTASPERLGMTPEDYLRANIETILATTSWADRQQVPRTVMISSDAVFTQWVTDRMQSFQPLNEENHISPDSLFGVVKALMEQLVGVLNLNHQRRLFAVRLSNIYGPYEISRPSRPRVSRIASMIHAALSQEHVMEYVSSPPMDWTYAPDIGRAIATILKLPDSQFQHYELLNVVSGQTYTPFQIAMTIKEHLPNVEVSVPNVEIGEPLGTRILHRLPLANDRFTEATNFTSWTSLHDGIGQTIAWMRKHLEAQR
jgi:nucleoside-diphosphate-sugar epimerase